MKKPYLTLSKMTPLIEEWQQSHQTQKSFCATKQISLHTFKYWLAVYRKAQLSKDRGGKFIPIATTPPVQENTPELQIVLPNQIRVYTTGILSTDLLMLLKDL